MNDEPNTHLRDEREFNASLEAHTPEWLPGIKLGLSFKRLWDKRPADFVRVAASTAGVAVEDIANVVENTEAAADMFATAARRASERSDPMYRDVLGRLVGAALADDAKIDEIGYVVDRLVTLEPIHVRLLSLLLFGKTDEAIAAGNPVATRWQDRSDYAYDLPLMQESPVGRVPLADNVAEVLSVSRSIVTACLHEMIPNQFTAMRSSPRTSDRLVVTELGITASSVVRDALLDVRE